MNPTFWDERFQSQEYVYGKEPHPLFIQAMRHIPNSSQILIAGDGEGRHAVYSAQKGHSVEVIDYSAAGKTKALKLAKEKNVDIQYTLADILVAPIPSNTYDVIAMVYAHFPTERQKEVHSRMWSALRKGGYFIIIGFGTKQRQYRSGGPQNQGMLYEPSRLLQHFPSATICESFDGIMSLSEGLYHQGDGHIVYYTLKK